MKTLFLSLIMALSFSASANSPVHTSKKVDIESFIGKWYAVSALPQFFTRKCLGQTAEYAIKSESEISVLNTCYKKGGRTSDIKGQARVVNFETNSELEVTFNSFFTRLFRVKGDYNIIKIDSNYQHVMVGGRNRKSLWIMSRVPNMRKDVYKSYVNFAKKLGYPVSKLKISKF